MSERCFKQHGWVQVMIFSKGLFVVSPWIFVFNLQLTPEGIIFKWKIYEKGVVVIISRGFKAEERTSTQITCKVAEHEHVNVPSRIKEGLKAPKATIWRWEYVANSKVSKTDSSCSYDQGAIHVRNVVECIIWHCKIHLKRIQNKHWIYKIYHEFHTKYLSIYIYIVSINICINVLITKTEIKIIIYKPTSWSPKNCHKKSFLLRFHWIVVPINDLVQILRHDLGHFVEFLEVKDLSIHKGRQGDGGQIALEEIFVKKQWEDTFKQKWSYSNTPPETNRHSTWKWMVGIRLFPFGKAHFQVRNCVSFREGKYMTHIFFNADDTALMFFGEEEDRQDCWKGHLCFSACQLDIWVVPRSWIRERIFRFGKEITCSKPLVAANQFM